MTQRKHGHYFKDVSHLKDIDVYRVLGLFGVTDQAIGHAVKKLLVAGGRGAGKDIGRDIQEAIDTLERWKELKQEDSCKIDGPQPCQIPAPLHAQIPEWTPPPSTLGNEPAPVKVQP